MITVDTSVAVAAALPWHEAHETARAALGSPRPGLIGHVAIETYSVLTRMPPPRRVPVAAARAYLAESFPATLITLSADGYDRLLDVVAERRIAGGAVYDALVAATAQEAGVTLLTLDDRAARTYQLLGVDYRGLAI